MNHDKSELENKRQTWTNDVKDFTSQAIFSQFFKIGWWILNEIMNERNKSYFMQIIFIEINNDFKNFENSFYLLCLILLCIYLILLYYFN